MWIIASRKSRLAMWQAEHVQALMQNNPYFERKSFGPVYQRRRDPRP